MNTTILRALFFTIIISNLFSQEIVDKTEPGTDKSTTLVAKESKTEDKIETKENPKITSPKDKNKTDPISKSEIKNENDIEVTEDYKEAGEIEQNTIESVNESNSGEIATTQKSPEKKSIKNILSKENVNLAKNYIKKPENRKYVYAAILTVTVPVIYLIFRKKSNGDAEAMTVGDPPAWPN